MKIGKVKQLKIRDYIEHYHASAGGESKSIPCAFKVASSQKTALKYIAEVKGLDESKLLRAAVELLLCYIDHYDILMEEVDLITPILEKLGRSK